MSRDRPPAAVPPAGGVRSIGCRASCRSMPAPRAGSRRPGPTEKSIDSRTACTSVPKRAPAGSSNRAPWALSPPAAWERAEPWSAKRPGPTNGPTSSANRSSPAPPSPAVGSKGSQPATAGSSVMAENDHLRGERSRRAVKGATPRGTSVARSRTPLQRSAAGVRWPMALTARVDREASTNGDRASTTSSSAGTATAVAW